MKGLFVNSTVKKGQGWTDFGYYVDGDGTPASADEFEEMVGNDEAYCMKLSVNYKKGVHIRLRSENRRVAAEVENDIGFKNRGLESTFYQATGSPRLPSTYEDRREKNQALSAFAEYALNHGEGRGLKAKDIRWDEILEDDSGL